MGWDLKSFKIGGTQMSVGIDELFDMLCWNSDEETQKRGIELAKDVKCFSVFLQPYGLEYGIGIWENCAKILSSYPDETLQYCSSGMLKWLENMTWPGAFIILDRLVAFSDTTFLSMHVVHCVKEALACDLQDWLYSMAALLANENLIPNLPKDIYDVLYVRYKP